MKQFFLTMTFVLLGLGIQAQDKNSFVFTDAEGNELADNATITIHDYTLDEGEGEVLLNSGIILKNVSGQALGMEMHINIKTLTTGKVKYCGTLPCMYYSETGEVTRDTKTLQKDLEMDMQTEYISYEGVYGTCQVTYQVYVYALNTETREYDFVAEGRTVTVNYVYDAGSVDAVAKIQSGAKIGKEYNLKGQEVGTDFHGVVIKDGKKIIR